MTVVEYRKHRGVGPPVRKREKNQILVFFYYLKMPITRSKNLSEVELESLEEQLKNREKRLQEQEEQFRLAQANFEELLNEEREQIRKEEKSRLVKLENTISSLKTHISTLESRINVTPVSVELLDTSVKIVESPPKSFSLTPRDVISEVPTFSGNNIPIDRFFQSCRRARDSLSPSQEPELVRIIRTKILGRAYCIIEDENFNRVDDLIDALRSKHQPQKSSYFYRGLLSVIFKKPTEHIIDYIRRVKDLKISIQDAERQENRSTDPDLNKFTLECFVCGLPATMKILLQLKGYGTLTDVYNNAIVISTKWSRNRQGPNLLHS